MSEQLRESLSAAMDDEADAFELRRVLDEAGADEALRDQWHRYHVMREVMRDQLGAVDPTALRDSIWRTLQADPTTADEIEEMPGVVVSERTEHDAKHGAANWLGRWAAGGVAAAVALAVGFAGGIFDGDSSTPSIASQSQPARMAVAPAEQLNQAQIAPVMYYQATPTDFQRQQGLMLRHIQHRAINEPSVASFVKMATFRTRPQMPRVPAGVPAEEPSATP